MMLNVVYLNPNGCVTSYEYGVYIKKMYINYILQLLRAKIVKITDL